MNKRSLAREYASYRRLRRDFSLLGYMPATVVALTDYLKSLRAMWRVAR